MAPETERLIHSINEKMDLLNKIMFGEDGMQGIHDDVKLIKRKLIGDNDFKEEGIIAKVERLDDFYRKMQNIGWFATVILGLGITAGSIATWFVHRWDTIKQLIIKE